ncbi:MAG: hypothetical protein AAGA03_13145 [Planctomycetota bacterium]
MVPLSFRVRRAAALSLTGISVAIMAVAVWITESRLGHGSVVSGSALGACVLLLMLLGVRRRLPIWPLGSVSTWTQIHIYTGLFAGGVYALHVPSLIGGGRFESGLSVLFLSVTASGVYGLLASRTLPKRMTALPNQTRFEQVRWHRSQIATAAERLLEGLSEPTAVSVLGSYYRQDLQAFFSSRPGLNYLILPHGSRRRKLLTGLQQIDRYLENEGRKAAGRLAGLIRRKDDLDYQYALQLQLRGWVLVHSVLSLMLLISSVVHVALVWRFLG